MIFPEEYDMPAYVVVSCVFFRVCTRKLVQKIKNEGTFPMQATVSPEESAFFVNSGCGC